jgi:hypothetical protein
MDMILQLKLAMLVRVLDFLQAFPLRDEPADLVVARFQEGVTRFQVLVAQEQDGSVARQAQTGRHKQLRRKITRSPLHHLAAIAGSLEAEFPQVAAAVRQSVHNVGAQVFLATVRSITSVVEANHDVLRSHGMAEGTLEELKALTADYEKATRDANAGRRAHTGARAEMHALSRSLMQLLRQLDGMVVYRFRDQPEILGAWKSARNVAWPLDVAAKSGQPPANGESAA